MTDSSTAVEALLSGLSTIRDGQEDFYRDLHAHPELSHQEYETAAKVAARLRDWSYDVHDRIGGTGVIGLLRNGPGPTDTTYTSPRCSERPNSSLMAAISGAAP